MTNLDDKALYNSLDKSGMGLQIYNLPEQCRGAWEKALQFSLPAAYQRVNKIVILGMGGSAIGGDLIRAIASSGKLLVIVHRDYDLPTYVDEDTLVIASSYSGDTEETLSGFIQALSTPCKKLVISTDGKLTSIAQQSSVPIFIIEHVSPPRAALGYSLLPLLAIMQNLGLVSSKSAEVDNMIRTLKRLRELWKEDVLTENNPAKKLALKLYGKITVIYGAGILSDAARRWKTQINENSKAWAFFETFPELNHNAVTGYRHPAGAPDNIFVVMLRCPSLHPRILTRYKATAELLEHSNIPYQILDSNGTNPLKHIMSLIYLGDWVSYYLSMLNNVDPTSVPEIELLKKRLSQEK